MRRVVVTVLAGLAGWAAASLVVAQPAAEPRPTPVVGPETAARSAGDAAAAGFSLSYDVYQSGLRALRLDFDVDLAAAGYRTQVGLQTAGIVGFLFDWHLSARSEGALREHGVAPARHRTVSVWRGRERTVEIAWRDGTPVEVKAVPPYGEDVKREVDASLLPGTLDPMSAVTGMILSDGGDACRPRTAIYDGRRRYDALLAPLGARRIEASAYATFAGKAEGCRLTFRRIAGFAESRSRLDEMSAEIWLADIGPRVGRVPVRLRLETPWGTGLAHLSQARDGAGRLVFGEPRE